MPSRPPPRAKASRQPKSYHHGNLRPALLAAAERELAEHGIEGFSLRGVAKRAGVSHAAPAHHFADATGLLTALAALGFERFVAAQKARQAKAATDGLSQLVAAGLGYIDFARAHPALFRLMFSSDRPDHGDRTLCASAEAAMAKLVDDVRGADPQADAAGTLADRAATAWALAHGLADLLVAGRLKMVLKRPAAEQQSSLAAILRQGLAPR